MGSETAGFREMGYGGSMGVDKRGSISGVFSSKAPSTDVDRDSKSLCSYGVHGKGKDGVRHSKRKSHKKRK